MKFNSVVLIFASAITLAGCSDSAKDLAKAGTAYGVCQLRDGAACKERMPAGFHRASGALVAAADTVAIEGELVSESDCRDFAAGAPLNSSDFIAQTYINGVIVAGYGNGIALSQQTALACQTKPFKVVLMVAKGTLQP